MFKGNDTKYVMLVFAVISFIMIYLMVSNFKVIDCCYFVLVLIFATRYLLLDRE